MILLAANNIKRFAFVNINTAGIVGFQACGDEGLPLSEKQEAQPIAFGVGGQFTEQHDGSWWIFSCNTLSISCALFITNRAY
jgi:hypothetical protein